MKDTFFEVLQNSALNSDTFRLLLRAEKFDLPRAGSFINISVPGRTDLILRRPFALTDWDAQAKTVELCYKVVGEGTRSLATLKSGEVLSGIFPLGNGFNLAKAKRIALIGGGVGVFPLLSVLRKCGGEGRKFFPVIGYKDSASAVFYEEFAALSDKSFVCTDDCSLGEGGFATDLFLKHYEEINPDLALACGPVGMLKALQKIIGEKFPDLQAYVSLEERMCCGFGACIVCTCAIDEGGEIKNKRVCRDGPVFRLSEVVF